MYDEKCNLHYVVCTYIDDMGTMTGQQFFEALKQKNKKSTELKNNSKDIKDKIDKYKTSKLNKDNEIS